MDTNKALNKTKVSDELMSAINDIVARHGNSEDNLIAVLLELQAMDENHHLSRQAMVGVSEVMGVRVQRIYEVASFYHALSTSPKGKYLIQMCQGTSCTVNKQKDIMAALESKLGIKVGETTDDMMFTLEYTPCFGACDVSPAMRLNGKVYGNLDVGSVEKILEECGRDCDE